MELHTRDVNENNLVRLRRPALWRLSVECDVFQQYSKTKISKTNFEAIILKYLILTVLLVNTHHNQN